MARIAKVTGAGGADVGPGNLAIGNLAGSTDALVFNFVTNVDFGCMGVQLSGAFDGGSVEFRGGIGLGSSNPPYIVTDSADGTHAGMAVSLPGVYFLPILTDTMRFSLVGAAGSADIDLVVYSPFGKYYFSGYPGSVA